MSHIVNKSSRISGKKMIIKIRNPYCYRHGFESRGQPPEYLGSCASYNELCRNIKIVTGKEIFY